MVHPFSAIFFFPPPSSFAKVSPCAANTRGSSTMHFAGRVEIPVSLLQAQQLSPGCPSLPTAAGDVAVRGRGCPVPPAPPGDAAHRPRLPAPGARGQRERAAHQPLRGRVRKMQPLCPHPHPMPCYSPEIFQHHIRARFQIGFSKRSLSYLLSAPSPHPLYLLISTDGF